MSRRKQLKPNRLRSDGETSEEGTTILSAIGSHEQVTTSDVAPARDHECNDFGTEPDVGLWLSEDTMKATHVTDVLDVADITEVGDREGKGGEDCESLTGSEVESMDGSCDRHQDAEMYSCPLCDQLCSTPRQLTTHVRQHNGSGNPADGNVCGICGKFLSSASSLDRHMLVHSGERPHRCRVCGQTFTTSGNMQRHLKIHEKDGVSIMSSKLHRTPLSLENGDGSVSPEDVADAEIPVRADRRNLWPRSTVVEPQAPISVHGCRPRRGPTRKRHSIDSETDDSSPGKRLREMSLWSGAVICPSCLASFSSESLLDAHLEEHVGENLRCCLCGPTFKSRRSLLRHACSTHRENAADCKREAGSISDGLVSKTLRFETGVSSGFRDMGFVDFSCGKFPVIAQAWCERYARRCFGKLQRFVCETCGKAFPLPLALSLHCRVHHCSAGLDAHPDAPITQCAFLAQLALVPIQPKKPTIASSSPTVPSSPTATDFLGLLSLCPRADASTRLNPSSTVFATTPRGDNHGLVARTEGDLMERSPQKGCIIVHDIAALATPSASGLQDLAIDKGNEPLVSDPQSSASSNLCSHVFVQRAMPQLKPKPGPKVSPISPLLGPPPLHPAHPLSESENQVETSGEAADESSQNRKPTVISADDKETENNQSEEGHVDVFKPVTSKPITYRPVRRPSSNLRRVLEGCDQVVVPVPGKDFPATKTKEEVEDEGEEDIHQAQKSGFVRCSVCHASASSRNALLCHLYEVHGHERPFACSLCLFAFTLRANCERHVRRRHPAYPNPETDGCIEVLSWAAETVSGASAELSLPGSETQPKSCEKPGVVGHPFITFSLSQHSFTDGKNETNVELKSKNNGELPAQSPKHWQNLIGSEGTLVEMGNQTLELGPSSSRRRVVNRQAGRFKPYQCRQCQNGFSTKSNCLRHIQSHHPSIAKSGETSRWVLAVSPPPLPVATAMTASSPDPVSPAVSMDNMLAISPSHAPPVVKLEEHVGWKDDMSHSPIGHSVPQNGLGGSHVERDLSRFVAAFASLRSTAQPLRPTPLKLEPVKSSSPLLAWNPEELTEPMDLSLPKKREQEHLIIPHSNASGCLALLATRHTTVSRSSSETRNTQTPPLNPSCDSTAQDPLMHLTLLARGETLGVGSIDSGGNMHGRELQALADLSHLLSKIPPSVSNPTSKAFTVPDSGSGPSLHDMDKKDVQFDCRSPNPDSPSKAKSEKKQKKKKKDGSEKKGRTSGDEPVGEDKKGGFPCPHCPRVFPKASALRRHGYSHSGQKPYGCLHCGARFTTRSNCNRHQRQKHGSSSAASQGTSLEDNDVHQKDKLVELEPQTADNVSQEIGASVRMKEAEQLPRSGIEDSEVDDLKARVGIEPGGRSLNDKGQETWRDGKKWSEVEKANAEQLPGSRIEDSEVDELKPRVGIEPGGRSLHGEEQETWHDGKKWPEVEKANAEQLLGSRIEDSEVDELKPRVGIEPGGRSLHGKEQETWRDGMKWPEVEKANAEQLPGSRIEDSEVDELKPRVGIEPGNRSLNDKEQEAWRDGMKWPEVEKANAEQLPGSRIEDSEVDELKPRVGIEPGGGSLNDKEQETWRDGMKWPEVEKANAELPNGTVIDQELSSLTNLKSGDDKISQKGDVVECNEKRASGVVEQKVSTLIKNGAMFVEESGEISEGESSRESHHSNSSQWNFLPGQAEDDSGACCESIKRDTTDYHEEKFHRKGEDKHQHVLNDLEEEQGYGENGNNISVNNSDLQVMECHPCNIFPDVAANLEERTSCSFDCTCNTVQAGDSKAENGGPEEQRDEQETKLKSDRDERNRKARCQDCGRGFRIKITRTGRKIDEVQGSYRCPACAAALAATLGLLRRGRSLHVSPNARTLPSSATKGNAAAANAPLATQV
uniref:ras-responsive element-binding protein 1-like n=1 Tax=Myxine glutinosa TaxID=7769 RepID=UPI00358FBE9C